MNRGGRETRSTSPATLRCHLWQGLPACLGFCEWSSERGSFGAAEWEGESVEEEGRAETVPGERRGRWSEGNHSVSGTAADAVI